MASALRRKCHSPRQERHPPEEHRLEGREQAEELGELSEVYKELLAMRPQGKGPMKTPGADRGVIAPKLGSDGLAIEPTAVRL